MNISLYFLHAVINVVKWSESDVPHDLSPGWQLVDGSLRAFDLGWLHCGGSSELILLLTGMLREDTFDPFISATLFLHAILTGGKS